MTRLRPATGQCVRWFIYSLLLLVAPVLNGQHLQMNADQLGSRYKVLPPEQLWFYLDARGKRDEQGLSPESYHLVATDSSHHWQIPARQTGWFRFSVENVGHNTDLNTLLCVEAVASFLVLDDGYEVIRSGESVNRAARPFPDRQFCLPIHLSPGSKNNYALAVNNIQGIYRPKLPFTFVSLTQAYEELKEQELAYQSLHYFFCAFFAVLLYMLFFSLIQFKATRDKAYFFYSLYLFGLFIFYFRKYAKELHVTLFFDRISAYTYHIEHSLTFLIFAAYCLFVMYFLNIDRDQHTRTYRLLKVAVYAFLVLTVLDLAAKQFLDIMVAFQWNVYLRVLLFPLNFVFLSHLIRRYHGPLKYYIILGTLMILLPGTFVVFVKVFPGTPYWYPFYRSFETTSGMNLYMYRFEMGALVEIIFFSLGLSYRTRKQQERASADKAEAQRIREVEEEKNRFYTNITHEFRSPLTVVKSVGETLFNKTDKQSQDQGRLLLRNANRSLQLIDQILNLRKLEGRNTSTTLQTAELISFLHYLAEPFAHLAKKQQIIFGFHTEVAELRMAYDPEMIQQIMENLLSNALKFTPRGGSVQVYVQQLKAVVQIAVQDTGIGIDPADQERIFERFIQLDDGLRRRAGGSGIGLALVKEIVSALNGRIEVASEPGRGSCFTVWLPLHDGRDSEVPALWMPAIQQSNEAVLTASEEEVMSSTQYATILLVDDEPDILKVLTTMLSGQYRLLTAANGREGLEIIRQELPQVIISDIMMPELDGLELCRLVKNDPLTCHIPVILLTARSSQKDRIEGLEQGADAYLVKPFSQAELFVRLEQLQRLREQLRARYAHLPAFLPATDLMGQQHDDFINQALAAIGRHFGDADFGPDELARALCISRTGLYSKLTALTGSSAGALINQVRLEKAQELLLHTDLPIKDIAYRVGYNSPDYFGRTFKERFCATPRAYRNKKVPD